MKTSARAMMMAVLVLGASVAHAVDGQADKTFGGNGRTFLGWGTDPGVTRTDVAGTVLALSDDSLILVGNVTDSGPTYGSYNAIGIAKLKPNGQFDLTFGNIASLGQTKIHGGGASLQIRVNAAALQPDGKIVIVGNTYFPASTKQMITVWRLNPDGTVDTSFGFSGVSEIDRGQFEQFDSGNAVAVLQGLEGTPYESLNGRIVIAGSYDFDPSLVIGSDWIVQLDSYGLPVPNTVGSSGSATFESTASDCDDGRHDQAFSALRVLYQAEAQTLTYYLAGNCIPRPGTGRIFLPYIMAIDSSLNLIPSFGNVGGGISYLEFLSPSHYYTDTYVTSLDVDPAARYIVFAGYTAVTSSKHDIFEGALSGDGSFNGGWDSGGMTAIDYHGSNAAYAIMIDPYSTALFSFAPSLIAGEIDCSASYPCDLTPGRLLDTTDNHGWVGAYYFGTPVSYCGFNDGFDPCLYEFNDSGNPATRQGFYSMIMTPSHKVVVAGYTLIDGNLDFAVMRLQHDQMFFNGFGPASQDYR